MLTKEPILKNSNSNKIFFNSARDAFSYLLSELNFQKNESILLPAYIGESIKEGSGVFDPIRKNKVNFIFYKLDKYLNIDLDDLMQKAKKNKIKAILVIHYFGVPQKSIVEISNFCKNNKIILIEDCVHSIFSKLNNVFIGNFGDYSIFSLHKVFPIDKGGYLQFNQQKTIVEIKDKLNRANLLELLKTDIRKMSFNRCNNFNYFLKKWSINKYITPFYKKLPKGSVPLNFPVLVKHLDRFELYKNLVSCGIPVVSLWYKLVNEIDLSEFKYSDYISKHILNFPIHQDISFCDIDRIFDTLQLLLNAIDTYNHLKIRQNTASDKELYNLLANNSNIFFPPLSKRINILEYTNKLKSNASIFECWHQDNLIGFIACYLNNPPVAFISMVICDSHYQNHGIGTLLLHSLINNIRSDIKFTKICLKTDKNNIKAQNFYNKMGFSISAEDFSEYIMELNLENHNE